MLQKWLTTALFSSTLALAQATDPAALTLPELSAVMGDYQAISVQVPEGTKLIHFRAVSQGDEDPLTKSSVTALAYAPGKTARLLVGLDGQNACLEGQQSVLLGISLPDSSSRMATAYHACLKVLPGEQNVAPVRDTAHQGQSLSPATKLNTWLPIHAAAFVKASQSLDSTEQFRPQNQIVWWVYFSDSDDWKADRPEPGVYTPKR